jgi:hypothetical protein
MRRGCLPQRIGCAVVLCTAILAVSCGECLRDESSFRDGAVVYDFVANLPAATFDRDTVLIDMGTAPARAYLLSGWVSDRGSQGMTTIVGVGDGSALEFSRSELGPVQVTLRCLRQAAIGVSIELNGTQSRDVELTAGWSDYRVEFSPHAVRRGSNILRLHYRRPSGVRQQPLDFQGSQAAIECDTVRFERPDGTVPALPTVEGAALNIPVGGRVDYFVRVPLGSGMTFNGPVTLDAPGRATRGVHTAGRGR